MNRLDNDVIIVGAGPTGLLLAGDLAAAGVSVSILEKRDTESNLTRAFAVHARTLETLDMRGLADPLTQEGSKEGELLLVGRARLRLSDLDSRFPYVLITPQYRTEQLLRDRALANGARIESGVKVTELTQDGDGVELIVETAAGTQTRTAAYVVGTDGVHSVIRERLGLPFPGQLAAGSIMLADVRLSEPPPETLTVRGAREGFVFIAPFGDGWYRIVARHSRDTTPDDVPVDFEDLRSLVRHVFGTDFGMTEPRWTSRFHSDERQAPRYRVGRVFLAGDAAHVHSPAGGQGMNTGLQDAANLGWKLAAAVRGHAPEGLLDSYETERHPIGAAVLKGSGALLRLVQLRNGLVRAVRDAVMRLALRTKRIRTKAAGAVSGIAIRYPAGHGSGDAVGTRMPDIPLATVKGQSNRLYETLRGGRFVLVTGSEGPEVPENLTDLVDVVNPEDDDHTATLVRPDGYIAWRGAASETPNWSAWLRDSERVA
ncbi:FAD-dependent oxidoreductase [Stackebrandtia nassauensis]|uniref:Monooxygenase FAD-binding protein n=1 Tax=Stackebrandtia nassauensis (strain DSM 44728 / CIP 108903 / NRRL B-16338 / NBRC 102104 / LLR-40K-21) TaxID=446470 RepID=D3Q7V7_STANL|nr:FAD-dependent oxidoreductase [Stackebrandtia nassauensis]ADD40462.1 monooxygenase FAD-binding protein [Stackebrandtia nassauensis DSM 44728]